MEAILGIDLGTTGIRATLLGASGQVLARCSRVYDSTFGRLAASKGEAECSVFLDAAKCITADSLEEAGIPASAVAAVAISAMAPDAVAVDAAGRALTPCILWMDRRAVAEAEAIRSAIGESRILRVSGNPVDPYYGLVKTLWIRNNLPDVYRRAEKILSLKDYLVGELTGRLATDVSHAGLFGIAYDIRANRWDPGLLRDLGLDRAKLPDPLAGDEIAGRVTAGAAAAFGLIQGTPVAAGSIDSAAGYLACGCLGSGQSAMTLGSSSCWGVYTQTDGWPKFMNVTRAPWNRRGYLINASLAAGGIALDWLENLFGPEGALPRHGLEARAAEVPIGCGGLLTLPHFLGERSPLWDPHARGVLFGLHPGHGPAELYRSGMEGIALSLYRNKLLLAEAGVVMKRRIPVTGGWARSPLLRRILADVLDSTVDLVGEERSSDYGAAWLAGKAVGMFAGYELLGKERRIVETVEPEPSAHRRYARLYKRIYGELYPRVKELYPRLTESGGG